MTAVVPALDLREALGRLVERRDLTADEMAGVVGRIMDGEATPAQVGALLTALRMKGETVDEVVGAARAMRARMLKPEVNGAVYVDLCGTGGDGSGSVNVSTIASFVVAACGVPVAKHGNRAMSSKSGSHDVIEALGLDPAPGPQLAGECLRELKLCFLFAPAYHAATKHAVGPRREVGFRTFFNLLGPLTNPAGARHHVNGVFASERCDFLARAHGQLGSARALVIHGAGGLDEFAPAGTTKVAELVDGEVRCYEVRPADFGLDEADPAGLRGGESSLNARLVIETLRGAPGAIRTAALMTAAAALYVTGAADDFRAGARRASEVLDAGGAMAVLEGLKRLAPLPVKPASILDDILAETRRTVARAKEARPRELVEAAAVAWPAPRGFAAALRGPDIRCIAEFKRRSPSAGWIREDGDPAVVARSYQAAGAAALSVLTDGPFFGGALADLERARGAVPLPALRKDFTIDPYQIAEARAAGADAVLLIVAALSDDQLTTLLDETRRWQLDALVEAHDADEVDRALRAGARLVGINHRDLRTFKMDMTLAERMRDRVPGDCVLVAESGIRTAEDVRRMRSAGMDAILVGESLMRAPDPGAALRTLLGSPP